METGLYYKMKLVPFSMLQKWGVLCHKLFTNDEVITTELMSNYKTEQFKTDTVDSKHHETVL